jgi:hypothetical protein
MRLSSDGISDINKFPPVPFDDDSSKNTDLKLLKQIDYKKMNISLNRHGFNR